ncbi:MAG: type II TA system antitoxin MqsA family protein [Candidatus Binataceae bacterium]
MAKNPRNYPETMASPESGRPMFRGEKMVSLKVEGKSFQYRQPGWWCSLDDPNDLEGQLVDEDNLVAEMARRTAEAMVKGESFTPLLIRAIRIHCKLSQREAGEVFGTGEKSFEKYESGQIRPSEPTKRLLCLAMKSAELFTKTEKGLRGTSAEPDIELIQRTIREAELDRLYAPMFQQR